VSGRLLTRRERAEATAEYLAAPHPSIELDRGRFLICRCAEGGCRPHRAHFREMARFNREATGAFPRRKAPAGEQEEEELEDAASIHPAG
jgi:hypothetical protein